MWDINLLKDVEFLESLDFDPHLKLDVKPVIPKIALEIELDFLKLDVIRAGPNETAAEFTRKYLSIMVLMDPNTRDLFVGAEEPSVLKQRWATALRLLYPLYFIVGYEGDRSGFKEAIILQELKEIIGQQHDLIKQVCAAMTDSESTMRKTGVMIDKMKTRITQLENENANLRDANNKLVEQLNKCQLEIEKLKACNT